MLRDTAGIRKRKKVKRRVRFPGIVAAAAALRCSRPHLWQVLTGRRRSQSLTRRYHALAK